MNMLKHRLLPICVLLVLSGRLLAQCAVTPIQDPASTLNFCISPTNDTTLWADQAFYDPLLERHDLWESPVSLSLSSLDTCGVAEIISVLELDLNGDGIYEAKVESINPPPPGKLWTYGAFQPVLHAFDHRNTPDSLKFHFILDTLRQGDTLTAAWRWRSAGMPNQAVSLPLGKHQVSWYSIKNGELFFIAKQSIIIKDCEAPTVECANTLSVFLLPTNLVTVYLSDLLSTAHDNYLPASDLEFSCRIKDYGQGFPLNASGMPISGITFNCCMLGSHTIELWCRDKAGNMDWCEMDVIIQDNMGNCFCEQYNNICYVTYDSISIDPFETNLTIKIGAVEMEDISSIFLTNHYGACASFISEYIGAPTYQFKPSLDTNHLDGVSTYDLVLINRHILGAQPFDSPLKIIAADANQSQTITAFDVVEFRKLILGIYPELPQNTSWKFYWFDSTRNWLPANPFLSLDPGDEYAPALHHYFHGFVNFIPVKIGDVDNSATPYQLSQPDDRQTLLARIQDRTLAVNETVEIPIFIAENESVSGAQLNLDIAPELALEGVIPGPYPGMSDECFFYNGQTLSMSWFTAADVEITPDAPLFTLRLRAKTPITLSRAIRIDDERLQPEAYTADGRISRLALAFENAHDAHTGFTVFEPMPNPTSADAQWIVRADQPAVCRLEIRDAMGRLVFKRPDIMVDQGDTVVRLPVDALDAEGLYFWSVSDQSGQTVSGKLIRW